MLQHCTGATFTPFLGQAFRAVPDNGGALDLVLSRCDEADHNSPGERDRSPQRVPFSLLFHASDGRYAEQQIFTLHHAELGEFPLFLVPLGPDQHGMCYEAVIS